MCPYVYNLTFYPSKKLLNFANMSVCSQLNILNFKKLLNFANVSACLQLNILATQNFTELRKYVPMFTT
jgi:hypothetical protein